MSNACTFFTAGLLMLGARLAPSVTGVREMWLLVMGGVMMAVGGLFFARLAWAWFAPRMVTPLVAVAVRQRERAKAGAAVAGRRVEG